MGSDLYVKYVGRMKVKWEEIGNGVWICPLRLRAAQKEAKSRTAFARMLLMFFYKKEELKGKRLHELDQDIVRAIAGWLSCIGIYVRKRSSSVKCCN